MTNNEKNKEQRKGNVLVCEVERPEKEETR
jgi:hypothetical protein